MKKIPVTNPKYGYNIMKLIFPDIEEKDYDSNVEYRDYKKLHKQELKRGKNYLSTNIQYVNSLVYRYSHHCHIQYNIEQKTVNFQLESDSSVYIINSTFRYEELTEAHFDYFKHLVESHFHFKSEMETKLSSFRTGKIPLDVIRESKFKNILDNEQQPN